MGVRVVLLGRLADLAGTPELALAAPLDWRGLIDALPPALAEAAADPRNKVAVNGAVLGEKAQLAAREGDEVALLPPVSGG